MQIFDVILFFKLRTTIQQKTIKPTYLCLLGARKLAEGKGHETRLDEKRTLCLLGARKLAEGKGHETA